MSRVHVTTLRDAVYFNGHGASHALMVLAVCAVLGAGVATTTDGLRARHRAAATAPTRPRSLDAAGVLRASGGSG
jgi:hypothetical protein